MPTKNSKLITRLLLGVLLGVLLCILGCIGFGALNTIAGDGEQAPIRSLRVTIDESQQEEFFEQLRKFADKHGFDISIRGSGLSDELFIVDMLRYDLSIFIRNPFDPRTFRIGFYASRYPVLPASQETVDELLIDLKNYIIEIPNVTITEKLRRLSIMMDANQREELFTQLRKFADKHSLEFTLSFSSDKTVFFLEIYGDGFHVTSQAAIGSPREINIDFYTDINNESPTPIAQGIVDELLNDLKSFLGEIPNVTISE